MVAIASSSSVLRYSIQRGSIPPVKRATEQTQQAADALQAQAREEWRQVGNAEANARAIDARANQAIATTAQAKQDLVSFGAGTQACVPASKADVSNSGLNCLLNKDNSMGLMTLNHTH